MAELSRAAEQAAKESGAIKDIGADAKRLGTGVSEAQVAVRDLKSGVEDLRVALSKVNEQLQSDVDAAGEHRAAWSELVSDAERALGRVHDELADAAKFISSELEGTKR